MTDIGHKAPVTVVIPCFNEQDGLPMLLERLRRMHQAPATHDWHFLFVDDGSSDDTFRILLQATRDESWIEVLRHPQNMGLGAALRTGFAHVRSPIVCTMDSDCTYPPERLPELATLIRRGADVATASPWHPDNEDSEDSEGTTLRLTLSRSASLVYRAMIGQEVHTFTCLQRAYRLESLHALSFRADGFSAVAEIMLRSLMAGHKIAEVPMPLEARRFGESKLRVGDAIMAHMGLLTLTAATVSFRQLIRMLGR
ncbi:MAG: glycosyltransferase family 2 protein [Deltaproteobacteria bacterium]|nr:glycosyltransferase family 2 protein [Deltaproteobacteria bacterium]